MIQGKLAVASKNASRPRPDGPQVNLEAGQLGAMRKKIWVKCTERISGIQG